MSKAKEIPEGIPEPEPEAWVVDGCRSPLHFWQHYQHHAQSPEPALLASMPGSEGDVLVIRGFDNLLHYLDWYDSVRAVAGKESLRDEPFFG